MALLLRKRTDEGEKTLYAVSWENWTLKTAGHFYFLARDRGDAVSQLLTSRQWSPMTRIVAVAPAVGAHVDKDDPEGTVYYQ
jgi:hypothetical protein